MARKNKDDYNLRILGKLWHIGRVCPIPTRGADRIPARRSRGRSHFSGLGAGSGDVPGPGRTFAVSFSNGLGRTAATSNRNGREAGGSSPEIGAASVRGRPAVR